MIWDHIGVLVSIVIALVTSLRAFWLTKCLNALYAEKILAGQQITYRPAWQMSSGTAGRLAGLIIVSVAGGFGWMALKYLLRAADPATMATVMGFGAVILLIACLIAVIIGTIGFFGGFD